MESNKEMPKGYDPQLFEDRLYESWEKSGYFKAQDESTKPAFSIAMPPPNITGALHNGHALFVTLQDILTRWKRMSGYNTLWLPGTDHAGIATQMVVEKDLAKEKITRHQLGRKAFLERVWKWKEKHGSIIIQQMKKLGASADWSRLQFTMDPSLSKTVREVFVRLYEEKLIYRGTRIINWCVRCQTALSDLETIATERKSQIWHLRYDLSDGTGSITIATTRPETMLGDTAVAVHPDDERYQKFIGKKLKLPLTDREIPVIADEYVDPKFGSGGLKVTPGHDFNDYDLGQKHKLPILTVFDRQGIISASGAYLGLSTIEARKKIIEDLENQGVLVKVEDYANSVGLCQRCEQVVEPMISDQWFLNVKPLAEKAIEAVRKGDKLTLKEVDVREDATKIIPEGWSATYYQWMENIRDWCISRQLWWGHQIPAWHCNACKHIIVCRTDPNQCEKCKSKEIRQDEDVLDTWFSSGLWPFSILGWPEKTKALQTFYPSSVMETGFDILFFWVARMMMMGMHFNDGRVPFKRIYLHAMVRDEKGQKMSKTKGNVIDPLDIIQEYGADAFRFTLSAMAGQGRDIKLSLERVEGYKSFCNKLWNASRFVLLSVKDVNGLDFTKQDPLRLHPINAWILSKLNETIKSVDTGFEEFRVNDSAQALYSFIWHEYCDWYIEFSKELMNDPNYKNQTQSCLIHVLRETLKLAHPIIPFISEEIYQHLPQNSAVEGSLMVSKFPIPNQKLNSKLALETVETWKEAIEKIRTFRGENGVNPKLRPKMTYEVLDSSKKQIVESGLTFIKVLAQLESLEFEVGALKNVGSTAELITKSVKFYVSLNGLVDVEEELKRVEKEKSQTLVDIEFVQGRLSKESFTMKAPKNLVDAEREKLSRLQLKLTELESVGTRLKKLKS